MRKTEGDWTHHPRPGEAEKKRQLENNRNLISDATCARCVCHQPRFGCQRKKSEPCHFFTAEEILSQGLGVQGQNTLQSATNQRFAFHAAENIRNAETTFWPAAGTTTFSPIYIITFLILQERNQPAMNEGDHLVQIERKTYLFTFNYTMTRFEPCLQNKNKVFEPVDSVIYFFCSNGHTTTTSFVCSLTQPPNNKQHRFDPAGKIEWDKMKLEDRAQSSMMPNWQAPKWHAISLSLSTFSSFPLAKRWNVHFISDRGQCPEETELLSKHKVCQLDKQNKGENHRLPPACLFDAPPNQTFQSSRASIHYAYPPIHISMVNSHVKLYATSQERNYI